MGRLFLFLWLSSPFFHSVHDWPLFPCDCSLLFAFPLLCQFRRINFRPFLLSYFTTFLFRVRNVANEGGESCLGLLKVFDALVEAIDGKDC
jgi:hypothetical protein